MKKQAQSQRRNMTFKRLVCSPGCGLQRVFIMTADVIVAGPLDSDCNCEYPPRHPPLLFHHFLPSSKERTSHL